MFAEHIEHIIDSDKEELHVRGAMLRLRYRNGKPDGLMRPELEDDRLCHWLLLHCLNLQSLLVYIASSFLTKYPFHFDMPTALVVGASRGIGKELVRALKQDGYNVIATARKPEGITFEEGIKVLQLDTTDESSIKDAAAQVDSLVSLIVWKMSIAVQADKTTFILHPFAGLASRHGSYGW